MVQPLSIMFRAEQPQQSKLFASRALWPSLFCYHTKSRLGHIASRLNPLLKKCKPPWTCRVPFLHEAKKCCCVLSEKNVKSKQQKHFCDYSWSPACAISNVQRLGFWHLTQNTSTNQMIGKLRRHRLDNSGSNNRLKAWVSLRQVLKLTSSNFMGLTSSVFMGSEGLESGIILDRISRAEAIVRLGLTASSGKGS